MMNISLNVYHIILIIIVTLCLNTVFAQENPPLTFGNVIKETNMPYAPQQFGSDFSRDDLFMQLPCSEKLIVFYQSRLSWQGHLLIVENGQNKILWTEEYLPPSALVPHPILASGLFNANATPDILISYTADTGTGSGSERWTQRLRVFFDLKSSAYESILLSTSDYFLMDEDPQYLIGENGKPATARESLVLILPAIKEELCRIVVWSKATVFEHPPTGTPQTETYRLESYRAGQEQWNAEETMEGSYQQTAESVRAIIEQRREQPDAPAPLLLNFSKPNAVLVDDEVWFEYFLREY